jgi:hypothetical protein
MTFDKGGELWANCGVGGVRLFRDQRDANTPIGIFDVRLLQFIIRSGVASCENVSKHSQVQKHFNKSNHKDAYTACRALTACKSSRGYNSMPI